MLTHLADESHSVDEQAWEEAWHRGDGECVVLQGGHTTQGLVQRQEVPGPRPTTHD